MRLPAWALILLAATVPARAAFDTEAPSARQAGLSDAYAAVADDVHALFFNPAGLVQLTRPEVSMQYGRLLTGLDDGSNLGQGLFVAGQPLTALGGAAAVGYSWLNLASLYQERKVSLGYGRTFMSESFAVGAAVNRFSLSYGTDDYSTNALDNNANAQLGVIDPLLAGSRGRSALGFDVGALYHASDKLDLGAALQNLNQPDLGLGEAMKIGRVMRLGAATWFAKGRLSADYVRRSVLEDQPDNIVAVGYETRWSWQSNEDLMLRLGGRVGSRSQRQASAGFGWRVDGLQLDYALTLPFSTLQTGNLSHRISLTYRFLGSKESPAAWINESPNAAGYPPEPPPAAVVPVPLSLPPAEAAPSSVPVVSPSTSAAPAPEPAPQPTPMPPPPASPAKAEGGMSSRSFAVAVARYRAAVTGGLTRAERIQALRVLLARFDGAGVDLAPLRDELESLIKAQEGDARKGIEAYEREWSRYQKIKERGASPAELIGVLDKMAAEYKGKGADLEPLEKEMKRLRRMLP